MKIELHEVESSNISKIGYDPDSKTLYVKFKGGSGSLWSYTPVSPEKYQEFSEAKSVGKFFAREFRDKAIYDAAEVLEEIEEA